ncbi:MAG: hemolysin family protein [Ignavibacteriaceae bacterium]|nr:hemolysin family protein [Ignavibacteriaceae bacterium]
MINDILLLVILVLISAFFSGSEIAFVTGNKLKIEIKARKNNLSARSALYFTNNPQNFFSTILIGNSIASISFASLSALFLARIFGFGELLILIISTFVLLIFGELLPKYISSEISDRIVLISAVPLRIISFILYPFVMATSWISTLFTSSSSLSGWSANYLFDKEDIETLVKESHEAGVVNKKESDIISRVLEVGDQRVHEAMRPRTEIVGIEIESTVQEALDIFIESGYSKLPVYEGSLDNIKGVIFAYDLFNFPPNLQSILREILFVPETKRSFDMLSEFLSNRVSISAVVDEFGGTAGIVTMEDIIEELFGEIKDEYDKDEEIFRKIADNTYIISGKVEVDLINEKFNLNIPEGNYETLGGFITSKLGRIPAQGEKITIDNFEILIAKGSNTRIDVVKIISLEPHDE